MYSKFLIKFINEFPTEAQILNNYPKATDFDKCILLLRSMKFTYGQISSKMGSPSKKEIRSSLLKWAPELIEEDCNRNKLKAKIKVSKEEFELICLLKKLDTLYPFYMGHPLLGHWRFMIVEGKLYYMEDDNSVWPFGDYDHVCQYQFLNIIKQQINEQKD